MSIYIPITYLVITILCLAGTYYEYRINKPKDILDWVVILTVVSIFLYGFVEATTMLNISIALNKTYHPNP